MIPILYNANEITKPVETRFKSNGIGVLADATSCKCTEERNGIYECEFSYPITGIHYSDISPDRIIKAKASEYGDLQLFRIYRASKPINGIVKFYAQHISYDLNTNPVIPFEDEGVNAATALSHILTHCYYAHNFTATSTLSSSAAKDFKVKQPTAARRLLGGQYGSILDLYGGEYEFDNFNIKLHAHRGQDTGVTILYGKNLTDITSNVNIASTYTSIYPFAKDSDENLYTLPEKVIALESQSNYGEARTLILDLSDKFDVDETITVTKLREKANAYLSGNSIDKIYNNIEIKFAQLWQSEEYKEFSLLERVGLCDTVTVKYEALGVAVKAKVIKTVYDTLTEKYEKIELGNAKSIFGDSFISANSTLELMEDFERTNKSAMEKAIERATALITGQTGGYVVLNQNESTGQPFEILVMNQPDVNTATKMWRWNLGGLGYSSNGYNGPYGTAITMDGAIVADYITTGVINASLIKTGTIEDEQHTNYWNMNTGEFRLSTSAKVGSGSTAPTLASYVSGAASGQMTQQNVFNALTNNGQLQGIYMSNGNLYINGTYIQAGQINANLITTGSIVSSNGNTYFDLATGEIGSELSNGRKMTLNTFGLSFYAGNTRTVSINSTSGTYSYTTITISNNVAVTVNNTYTSNGIIYVGNTGIADNALIVNGTNAIAYYTGNKKYINSDYVYVSDLVVTGSIHLELGGQNLPFTAFYDGYNRSVRFLQSKSASGELIRVLGFYEDQQI